MWVVKWEVSECGIRIPCMKSNELYTIQYDANYFGFLRFDMHDRGEWWIITRILLQGHFNDFQRSYFKCVIPKSHSKEGIPLTLQTRNTF